MRLKQLPRDESGSALIAAIIILFVVLGLGMAVLSQADVQSHHRVFVLFLQTRRQA